MARYDEIAFKNVCSRTDYHQVIAYLEGLEDGAEMLAEYKAVFEGGKYWLNVDNAKVTKVLHAYEDYLKWVLSNESTQEERQRVVVDKFKPFFPRARFYARFSVKFAYYSLHNMLRRFFKRHGYFSSIGEIAPFFNISLWGKQTKRAERVELPDETIDIEVVEMGDVITRDWMAYLSMDKIGAGGWVTKKGCTFFEKQFEVGTDEYKYILLAHEAQHFLTTKIIPE